MRRSLTAAVLWALTLMAQEPSRVERYLTDIARKDWTAREARIASIHTPAQVTERQRYVRSKIAELLGGFPERTPLNARITGSFSRDGYRVDKLIYESRPKFYVTADLYVPTSGHARYPAVVGVAGHAETSKAEPLYQRGWISLAKRGYIVLAFDPPGQGERSQLFDARLGRSSIGIGTPEHTSIGLQCILTGGNFAQYEIWDGIRAVDYLLTRADVDPKRIAVAGNSGGGTQAAYLAALEPRLASAAPSCFLTSSEKLWTDLGPQDAEQNIVGFLAAGLDLKDFALAFAPRPFQFLAATRDFFPIAGAHDAFAEAKRIYEIMGHPERVNFFEYDDTHGWSQPRREATYRWFQKWLNDQPLDQGAETQFEVEPEVNLRATPTGQTANSLGGETVQSLNAQLAERLAKSRPALRGEALKAAILKRMGPQTIHKPSVTQLSEIDRDGYRVAKIEIDIGEGIRVPAIVATPSAGPERKPAVLYLNATNSDADIEALVRAGQIVLAPTLRGWGEPSTRARKPPHTALYALSMRAMLVGRTIAGMQTADVLGAEDYLASLPNADKGRIGVLAKGNATAIAMFAAALQPRIHKVACEGGPISYLDIARARLHGEIADIVMPGVLQDFDLPDVASALGSRLTRVPDRPEGSTITQVYGAWLAR